jgi:Tol biopolymer transport system component
MKKLILITCALLVAAMITNAQQTDFSKLIGPYLGQKPPGEKAELFGDGILSTGLSELNTVFFPGGKEVIFSVQCGDMKWALVMTREENGRWREPEVAPFSGEYGGVDPFVSYDGNRVYFCSNRPTEDGGLAKADYDIWYVERSGGGWDKPVRMDEPINSDTHEFYPTLTRSGTIYFQSRRPGGIGNSDIYRAELVDGRYVKAGCLPAPVNSSGFEGDAMIAPDESYIIVSTSRGTQPMAADLYISFRKAEGKWMDLVNMGPDINGLGGENCQMLSPCGRYLFFTGRRYNPEKVPATYAGLKARHNGSLNGLGDSFWVDAKIIEELRPKE